MVSETGSKGYGVAFGTESMISLTQLINSDMQNVPGVILFGSTPNLYALLQEGITECNVRIAWKMRGQKKMLTNAHATTATRHFICVD